MGLAQWIKKLEAIYPQEGYAVCACDSFGEPGENLPVVISTHRTRKAAKKALAKLVRDEPDAKDDFYIYGPE